MEPDLVMSQTDRINMWKNQLKNKAKHSIPKRGLVEDISHEESEHRSNKLGLVKDRKHEDSSYGSMKLGLVKYRTHEDGGYSSTIIDELGFENDITNEDSGYGSPDIKEQGLQKDITNEDSGYSSVRIGDLIDNDAIELSSDDNYSPNSNMKSNLEKQLMSKTMTDRTREDISHHSKKLSVMMKLDYQPFFETNELKKVFYLGELQRKSYESVPFTDVCYGNTSMSIYNTFKSLSKRCENFLLMVEDFSIIDLSKGNFFKPSINLIHNIYAAHSYDIEGQHFSRTEVSSEYKLPHISMKVLKGLTGIGSEFTKQLEIFYKEHHRYLQDGTVVMLLSLILTLSFDHVQQVVLDLKRYFSEILYRYLKHKYGPQKGSYAYSRNMTVVEKIIEIDANNSESHCKQVILNEQKSKKDASKKYLHKHGKIDTLQPIFRNALMDKYPMYSSLSIRNIFDNTTKSLYTNITNQISGWETSNDALNLSHKIDDHLDLGF